MAVLRTWAVQVPSLQSLNMTKPPQAQDLCNPFLSQYADLPVRVNTLHTPVLQEGIEKRCVVWLMTGVFHGSGETLWTCAVTDVKMSQCPKNCNCLVVMNVLGLH
jgi:hypothetical protein